MKSLNILELHRMINEKKSLKREVYEIILSKCHKRIEITTQNQKLSCYFEISEFILGYPLYDLNKCIEFLIDSLTKNGFFVKFYFPKILYISWDLDEIADKPKSLPPVLTKTNYLSQPLPQVKTINTYKPLLSSSIQKNNGKISLNLL